MSEPNREEVEALIHNLRLDLWDKDAPNTSKRQAFDALTSLLARLSEVERERKYYHDELHKIADVVERHWKGAGAKLESEWLIKEYQNLGRMWDKAMDETEAAEARLSYVETALAIALDHIENSSEDKAAMVLKTALQHKDQQG